MHKSNSFDTFPSALSTFGQRTLPQIKDALPSYFVDMLPHYGPGQNLRVPEVLDIQHIKVLRFSALLIDRLYPQETFLLLISVEAESTSGP